MSITTEQIEAGMFQYVDQIKELMSARIWENVLLDCSKNELFILWLIFRHNEVNMTQISEYIKTPLNTATGIVSRMEKRQLILRERSEQDKRIVTVRMGEKGKAQIQTVMKELIYYAEKVLNAFSTEELELLIRMFHTLVDIVGEERKKESSGRKFTRISIE